MVIEYLVSTNISEDTVSTRL